MAANFCRIASEILFMENIKVIFGERLKAKLDEKGWSNSYFADRLKTSPANVTRWIQGKTAPHLEMLEKVAKELGMKPYELIMPAGKIKMSEKSDILTDDALMKIIKVLGFVPPKRLKRAQT